MALNMPREQLREENDERALPDSITYVSTFDGRNTSQKIQVTCRTLQKDTNLKEIFGKTKIINCRRQPPNLKQILARAAFIDNKKNCCVNSCGNEICILCSHIIKENTFTFKD